jgi:hypothetical protein
MPLMKWNSKPIAAASAKNVEYIGRDSACDDLSFHNLNELETGDKQQNKTNAIAYAEERLEQEKDTRGDRTHYRFVLTFDRDVSTQEAKEMAHEYIKNEFPDSKCIIGVHQEKNKTPDKADKEKFTHVHCWMSCRDINDKKLNIQTDKFKTMDERWTKQYDKKYGTEYEKQFKELKIETEQWKKDYAKAKENGTELPKKPERVADTYFKDKKEKYIEKDKEAAGITYDKTGTHRNNSVVADGQRGAGERENGAIDGKPELPNSEQQLTRSEQAINRANSAIDAADRGSDELSNSVSKLAERELPDRDLGETKSRSNSRNDSYDR